MEDITKMANVARLTGFADLSYVGKYAERFGMDPDIVITKGFNTVMNFVTMWKEQDDFQARFNYYHSMMKKSAGQ